MSELQVAIEPEILKLIKDLHQHPVKGEAGGILLGKVQNTEKALKVDILGAISAKPHESFIKEFHYDHTIWRELYAAKAEKYPDLEILGWYRSSSEPALTPNADDIAIQKAYFDDKHQIFLMVNPQVTKHCIFQWDKSYLVPLDEPDESPEGNDKGFTEERQQIFAAPSSFPELSKEVESLVEQTSQVTSQMSSMLERKQNEPLVDNPGQEDRIPFGLKIMGGLAGLLTLLTLIIYPIIKTASESTSSVATGPVQKRVQETQAVQTPPPAQTSPPVATPPVSTPPAVETLPSAGAPPVPQNVAAETNKPATGSTQDNEGTRTYTVQPGDSLWKISEKLYGSGFKCYLLISANGITTPSHLNAGLELVVPPDK